MLDRILRVGGHLLKRGKLHAADAAGFHLFQPPAGDVKLNETAAALLKLCDGSMTRAEIVAAMLRDGSAIQSIQPLYEFLDAAIRSAWVVELSHRTLNVLPLERRI